MMAVANRCGSVTRDGQNAFICRAMGRKAVLVAWCVLALVLAESALGLEVSNYHSPRNRHRPIRPFTRYIVLHTTEGPKPGSLAKIRRNGEAHYFVDTRGKVFRIIDKGRIATHAGRSMWDGRTNLDNYSVGIEVVGYHNRDLTRAQYGAVKELVGQLQRLYKIPDERVLCHAMVAYGVPNRWHRHSHRGRKRCGMLFARRPVRLKLGLTRQPTFDPDVKRGRLVVADPYLAKVLYGTARDQNTASARFSVADASVISATRSAWDIARERYNSPSTTYILPNGTKRTGDSVKDWRKIPAGTRVNIATGDAVSGAFEGFHTAGKGGASARDLAGDEGGASSTIYFFPSGMIRRGDELTAGVRGRLPAGTRVLVGYVYGGYVTAKRSAYTICGKSWNYPSTYYRFPDGTIKVGDSIEQNAIPKNTLLFFRQ